MEYKLEAVVVPVADVDRARHFYRALGFRLDTDQRPGEDTRIVRLTPPGSSCSIVLGSGIGPAEPGSARGLVLTVSDLAAARAQLLTCGLTVGPDREVGGYACAEFSDPDGNGWILVEAPIVATP